MREPGFSTAETCSFIRIGWMGNMRERDCENFESCRRYSTSEQCIVEVTV